MTVHVAISPTEWRTVDLLGHYVSPDGSTLRQCVEGYVFDQGVWRLLFAVAPGIPANLRTTDLGTYSNRVGLAWDASARAVSYNVYYRTSSTGALTLLASPSATSYNVTGMSYDLGHEFFVEAVDSGGRKSPGLSNRVGVLSGHEESAVAAGSHAAVRGWMNSQKRFRAGQWDYDNPDTPDNPTLLWGWFDNEANAYWTFMEMYYGTMRQVMVNHIGEAGNYPFSVSCTGAAIEYDRFPAGSSGSNIAVEIQLGNGISYASAPTQQGNRGGVIIYPTGARRSTGIWANWFQAIYQQHSGYNGLLIPPRAGGSDIPAGTRQPYGGMYGVQNSNSPIWTMSVSWPKIVKVAFKGTAAW